MWRSLFLITLLILSSGCGKHSDGDEAVLDAENPVGAPPPPIPFEGDYSPTPAPVPEVTNSWSSVTDFNRFNQTMGGCRNSMGHKRKLLKFLLMLLHGDNYALSGDEESRGFKPGSRAGACMERLGEGLGRLRHKMGRYRQGDLDNWVSHSTDWAVDNVQYPSYWPNGNVPYSNNMSYVNGSGQ